MYRRLTTLSMLAVAAALLPHPFNLSPIGALGLFAGARLPLRIAWLVPAIGVLSGQLAEGFYSPWVLMGVYSGLIGGPAMGRLLLSRSVSPWRVLGAAMPAAAWFFLTSNFGIWAAGYYPGTPEGLTDCYLMGLPYLARSLAADILFATLLFGLPPVLARLWPDLTRRLAATD